jgi:hypothetical protein
VNTDKLDFATLAAMRGGVEHTGPLDHACPLCGPDRQSEFNRTRPTLRTWKTMPGIISFYCARCEAKGSALPDGTFTTPPISLPLPPPRKPRSERNNLYADHLWQMADVDLPAGVIAYFKSRRILLDDVPPGALRFHPKCPWGGKKVPCIIARYVDALTGKPRGIWRRSADG